MSFEALSWGARHVVVVEPRRAAQTIIQANARSLGMTAEMTLMPTSAEKALQMLSIQGQRFDVIFCDPPWERGLSAEVASRIITVLKPNGWCIVEHRAGRPSPTLDQMWCFRPRRYGDTMLSFYEETQGVDR